MAKIIDEGKGLHWTSNEMICKSCGTVHSVEDEDILRSRDLLRSEKGSIDEEMGFYLCPACEVENAITIPRHVGNHCRERSLRIVKERNRQRKRKEILAFCLFFVIMIFAVCLFLW